MNNCKNMICYSIGSIDRDPTAGKEWRLELDTWLPKLGITHINPHQKPFKGPQEDDASREEIDRLKKERKFKEIREKYGYIRNIDLRCVDYASFLIARIDINIHLCGSYEEISLSVREKKPVLCHILPSVQSVPNWLVFMLPEWSFFDNMNEIKDYLFKIDSTPIEELDKRWTVWK